MGNLVAAGCGARSCGTAWLRSLGRVAWRPGLPAWSGASFSFSGASEAWRTRVVLVRFDPRQLDLSLETAFTRNEGWTVADADSGAALALDAGQFRHSLPWGWVVSEGKRGARAGVRTARRRGGGGLIGCRADRGTGQRGGRARARHRARGVPELSHAAAGRCGPRATLREAGKGVDLTHRDARLALGTLADGRVVVALTRFDALGESLGRVPFGLTTPEMAAVMGGLGCRHALLLDGGISGQLMVRTAAGAERAGPGRGVFP